MPVVSTAHGSRTGLQDASSRQVLQRTRPAYEKVVPCRMERKPDTETLESGLSNSLPETVLMMPCEAAQTAELFNSQSEQVDAQHRSEQPLPGIQQDPENPGKFEGKIRLGPPGSRIVACRRGNHMLEIEIPTEEWDCRVFCRTVKFLACCACATAAFLTIIGLILSRSIAVILGVVGIIMSFYCLCVLAFTFVSVSTRITSSHEYLTITPTAFKIERRRQLRGRRRYYMQTGQASVAPHTPAERGFCAFAEGATNRLTSAKIETKDNGGDTCHDFILVEGRTEHRLRGPLDQSEIEWLVSEINQFLEDVSSRQVSLSSAT